MNDVYLYLHISISACRFAEGGVFSFYLVDIRDNNVVRVGEYKYYTLIREMHRSRKRWTPCVAILDLKNIPCAF